ncbi:hypothetical protein [Segetibacter aerophilus]|uniref:O-antigen polymerase n=1 Tax=Segetibacter aerophilus TaxID=670293 RepID=A0A512B8N3_9BACT|nr:hypothetical protein [Segetibacter aerophilus]GEO08177.1 hypothetical protein SAE01_06730 [Segetibacter aerophilus]
MILIVLAVLLIVAFLIDTKPFPYLLMLYFVFYDMFDGFYKDEKIFSALRYLVPLTLILFYIIKYRIVKHIEFIFVALVSYLFLLWLLNAGDQIVTAKSVLPVIITLLMIPVGMHLGMSNNVIGEFKKYNRLLLIALPLYIVYANKVGIAGFYSDAFSTGFLITSRLYVIPIIVFLAIHYALTDKEENRIIQVVDISFILINTCMLLLSTRRTTLLMLAAAIMIYALFNKKLFLKMLMLVFILISALIISFPLYQERLMGQLEKRERIENLNSLEEEGRYLETFYLIDYHKKNRDVAEILFGVNLFDTYDFGTRYFGRDRPIHSDINMIIFSTGLVGLFLFILFFSHYFLNGNSLITQENKKLFYPLIVNFLIVLVPGRFIGTLTFPPLLMLLLAALKYNEYYIEASHAEENEQPVLYTY